MQIMRGSPDPSASPHFPLVYVLKGAWRTVSTRRSRRLPITPEILSAIANLLASQPPCQSRIMLWAAFCIEFFGFLRAGEFTCPSLIEFDNTSMLALQDVSVDSHQNPQYITVFLKRSKADTFGTGASIYLGRTFRQLCPVSSLLSYLASHPPSLGPLIVFQDGTPLSRSRLSSALAEAQSAIGVPSSGYCGHSFRIGAASAAAKAGLPDSLIQLLGRWK